MENIRLLLDHGADLLAKDANGLTALDLAEQGEHTQCMAVLKNAAGWCLFCIYYSSFRKLNLSCQVCMILNLLMCD